MSASSTSNASTSLPASPNHPRHPPLSPARSVASTSASLEQRIVRNVLDEQLAGKRTSNDDALTGAQRLLAFLDVGNAQSELGRNNRHGLIDSTATPEVMPREADMLGSEHRASPQATSSPPYAQSPVAHDESTLVISANATTPDFLTARADIERLQSDVAAIHSMVSQLQSSTPTSTSRAPPPPIQADEDDILSFCRRIDAIVWMQHPDSATRRPDDVIFSAENLRHLEWRIKAWEQAVRGKTPETLSRI
ncbi:hypothetical protein EMMF5_004900 [Cystobasidiomycetes sp. EMM_F5]